MSIVNNDEFNVRLTALEADVATNTTAINNLDDTLSATRQIDFDKTTITAVPTAGIGGGWVGKRSLTANTKATVAYSTTTRTITKADVGQATFTINDANSATITLTNVIAGTYIIDMTASSYWGLDTAAHEWELHTLFNTTSVHCSQGYNDPSGTSDGNLSMKWLYNGNFAVNDTLKFQITNSQSDEIRVNSFYITIIRITD